MADSPRIVRQCVGQRFKYTCLDGYVGSSGSEWVGGETDSDDDYYFPSGGSGSDDCDAYDYL